MLRRRNSLPDKGQRVGPEKIGAGNLDSLSRFARVCAAAHRPSGREPTMMLAMKRASQSEGGPGKTMWDAVERSRGGHERRWRLMRPMTQAEALEWAKAHS